MADTALFSTRSGVPIRKQFTGEEVLGMIAKGVLPSDEVALRTIRLAEKHWPEPDVCLFPDRLNVDEVRGLDVVLLIEIADTSIQDDLAVKEPKYREYGVREYWVIDLEARLTHVHLLDGSWPKAPGVPFEVELSPGFAPALGLKLAQSGM